MAGSEGSRGHHAYGNQKELRGEVGGHKKGWSTLVCDDPRTHKFTIVKGAGL